MAVYGEMQVPLASGKTSQRHALLKVGRPPLNPVYFTVLWDAEEMRTNICWGPAKCAGHFSYILT